MSVSLFLDCLTPGNPSEVRILAAECLRSTSDPSVVTPLLEAMADPEPALRVAAAEALGDIAARWVASAAHVAVDDGRAPQGAATALLARLMRVAVPLLERLMEEPQDPVTRVAAARVLAGVPHESALTTLHSLLRDPQADVLAAAALARGGDTEALERLIDVLADDGDLPERRLAAARALVDVSNPRGLTVLCDALTDSELLDKWIAATAIEDLFETLDLIAANHDERLRKAASHARRHAIQRRDEEIAEVVAHPPHAMLDQLISPDSDVRAAAGEAFLESGREPPLEDLLSLIDAHFDDDTDLTEVIAVLQRLRNRAAVPALTSLLNHHDWLTRSFAAAALGATRDPEALPALSRAVCDDVRIQVRHRAVEALVQLGDPRAWEVLLRAVGEDPGLNERDYRVARRAGKALDEIHGSAAIPGLLDLLRTGSGPVRRCAAWALGELRADEAIEALIATVENDRFASASQAAAWALGHIRAPKSSEALITLLENGGRPAARREAAWALGELKVGAAVPALISALHHASADVRVAATRALGEIRSPAAINGLSVALRRDFSTDVRRLAAWGLGNIGTPLVGSPLRAALASDVDPAVRTAIARALGTLRWDGAFDVLTHSARADPEAVVRKASVIALADIGDANCEPLLREIQRTDPAPEVRVAAHDALERLRRRH